MQLKQRICGCFFEHDFEPLTFRCRACALPEIRLYEERSFCLERVLRWILQILDSKLPSQKCG